MTYGFEGRFLSKVEYVISVSLFFCQIHNRLEKDINQLLKDDTLHGKEYGGYFLVDLPNGMSRASLEQQLQQEVFKQLDEYKDQLKVTTCKLIPPSFCYEYDCPQAENDIGIVKALPYIKIMKTNIIPLK